MSNRQARRDQARQRTNRPTPGTRAAAGSRRTGPSGGGGGGNGIMSGPFMLIVGAVVIALAAILAIVIFTGGGDDESSELADNLEEMTANLPTDMISGNKLGSDDAPVKITAFEDFQCPFCLRYTAEQEGQLVEEFVKTGRMQLEFKHLPILGLESVDAAMASQCAADQDMFWQYHHKLFLEQAEAGQANVERLNVGRFSKDKLKEYAGELGLDQAEFDQCLDSGANLEKLTADQSEASSFGIRGTPGFLVNGQPLGTGTPNDIESWRELVENVEEQLAGGGSPTPGASASPETTASASPEATATPTP